jgi:hypothetical protein
MDMSLFASKPCLRVGTDVNECLFHLSDDIDLPRAVVRHDFDSATDPSNVELLVESERWNPNPDTAPGA